MPGRRQKRAPSRSHGSPTGTCGENSASETLPWPTRSAMRPRRRRRCASWASALRGVFGSNRETCPGPTPTGFIQLKGGAGEMRIWVGDHRVIYEILDGELVILVRRIGHRREVYR
ncbi:type II toxin-antitoxin system RelE/ParE family toxin [Kocuria rhizophila]|nr:type II toxin-antitoxin system RelE/ParE family toxin [Kocuria rhizophila]